MAAAWQDSVRKFADEAALHYGSRLGGIYLFGSRARGDNREDSDADLAVILSDVSFEFWREKEAVGDIAYRRLLADGLYIQAIPFSSQEWNSERKGTSIDAIRDEAKTVLFDR